jgi:hypothetical protein
MNSYPEKFKWTNFFKKNLFFYEQRSKLSAFFTLPLMSNLANEKFVVLSLLVQALQNANLAAANHSMTNNEAIYYAAVAASAATIVSATSPEQELADKLKWNVTK